MSAYVIPCDGYAIEYNGGRLADVLVNGSAVECVQVRAYDFATGEFTEPLPSADVVAERVRGFIECEG